MIHSNLQVTKPSKSAFGSARRDLQRVSGDRLAQKLQSATDLGLAATICIAPFVFGGRHDLGRLVFVSLVAVTSTAWFVGQSLAPAPKWRWTAAYGILLAALVLVGLQLVPLPADWIGCISPRTIELFPLWSNAAGASLGVWSTISLTPHETTLALAMLVSYGLFFLVLTQRIQSTADIEKLLNTVAVAAVLMAAFGIVQFFTSNGLFFWCYLHPYRTTDRCALGSFMNRNHFAGFLVLGIGPLARWLVSELRKQSATHRKRQGPLLTGALIVPGLLLAGLTVVLLGIGLSLSKGGAAAAVAAAVTVGAIYWRWQLVDLKYACGLAGIGVVMLGLLSIYGYEELSDRFDAFSSGSIDELDRHEGRRKVWAANLAAIENGWLTGSGAGSHREICPVYLPAPLPGEYTHAENGYLQIATENGVFGIALLVAAIGLCGNWCLDCLKRLESETARLCFGAAAAGIAGSLVHSLVDFVWFIPACMSLMLALAATILRIRQLAIPTTRQAKTLIVGSRRGWWIEAAAAVCLAGIWIIWTYLGPGIAAIHWDRYLRAAVADADVRRELFTAAPAEEASLNARRDALRDTMLRHLEQTVNWNPRFARAHLRLVARYIEQFELAQHSAANAMTLTQLRGAAQSAAIGFDTPVAFREWLSRAVGPNVDLLVRAHKHAWKAVAMSPLQGEGYIYLAELSFLSRGAAQTTEACIAQARSVRPYDGEVLFEVGREVLLKGDLDTALAVWKTCFQITGPHQQRIIGLLAGRLPARVYLESLAPDWRTMRSTWTSYRNAGRRQDLNQLIVYAAQILDRDACVKNGIPPVYLWNWLAEMHGDLGQLDQRLECLEKAYHCDRRVYHVRHQLGYALKASGRYAEAEPHLRWCSARRPENKDLTAAILEVTKLRLAQREPRAGSLPDAVPTTSVQQATHYLSVP